MAEGVGVEPTVPLRASPAFKAGALKPFGQPSVAVGTGFEPVIRKAYCALAVRLFKPLTQPTMADVMGIEPILSLRQRDVLAAILYIHGARDGIRTHRN